MFLVEDPKFDLYWFIKKVVSAWIFFFFFFVKGP